MEFLWLALGFIWVAVLLSVIRRPERDHETDNGVAPPGWRIERRRAAMTSNDLNVLVIGAVRYALEQAAYARCVCVVVRRNLHSLSDFALSKICREIDKALARQRANGTALDRREWVSLYDDIGAEQKRRLGK